MKKVLFLIHDLGVGGAEKVLVNLVNRLDKSKFSVTVMALFGGGVNEKFLDKSVRYQTVFKKSLPANSKIMKLFSPKTLHKAFIKEDYDIEISYLEGPSARIISGCQNPNTKLVSWIHVEQHTKEMAAGAFRSYEEAKACYEKFDKTICVSEYVKEDFSSIFPSLKNLEVLYNTNATEEILEKMTEPVEEGLFAADEIKLCGVGKIVPVKGFDKLARVQKRLREDGYQTHFYALGVGPEQEKIEQYLLENGIAESYTFLGYQTNPYKYVAKCDLFLCASTAEGFSTAATESLIVGTPVVTVDVSGMKEMLGANGEYGIVTEQSEDALYLAVKGLLDDPKKLSEYKKKAAARGKFFSADNTVKAVEEMLEGLYDS